VRAVLARNGDYFDKGRPYLDEYVILSTPDAATRLAAFRTGQSDIIWLASLSEVDAVRKTNPAAVVQAYKNVLNPVRPRPRPGQAAVQRRAGAARDLDGHRPPEAGGHRV
jgi:ABC-type transport system substrate-binding protein